MRALDTNVLARYLVGDDAAQEGRAARIIENEGEPLFVADVVFCELTWVLASVYRFPRGRLVGVLRALLQTRQLVVADAALLGRALDAFELGKGDLADYVIREVARKAGCSEVVTFDRALTREPGFTAA